MHAENQSFAFENSLHAASLPVFDVFFCHKADF